MENISNSDIDNSLMQIEFSFNNKTSKIFLGQNLLDIIISSLKDITQHVIIIADEKVSQLWGNQLFTELHKIFELHVFTIQAKESDKNNSIVNELLEKSVKHNANKNSCIISFGGGLTGNIAGMVAGLLFRGLKLIHIPTTLLAMSDSILSQKQAVNSSKSKNSFGLYHHAHTSFIDVKYLETLPNIQITAGLVEICKNILAFDYNSRNTFVDLVKELSNKNLIKVIQLSIQQKQKLIINDPYENNDALVLEYGHTIGHALEKIIVEIPHGIAVGTGLIVVAILAKNKGLISNDFLLEHVALLKSVGFSNNMIPSIDFNQLIESLAYDNKRGIIHCSSTEYPFLILANKGEVFMSNKCPLSIISKFEIQEALFELEYLKNEF